MAAKSENTTWSTGIRIEPRYSTSRPSDRIAVTADFEPRQGAPELGEVDVGPVPLDEEDLDRVAVR